MSRSWASGSTRAWRKLRAEVLDRDGHRCQLRLARCTETAEHAHHTLGRAVTGDDPRHVVAACANCNLDVGQPDVSPAPIPRTAW